jgi:transcriptional regulator with XRE-family HTH domain
MNDHTERSAYRIGRRIASRRALLGWTSAALAERAGISRVTLSRIETGRVGKASADTLARIAAVLGVSVDWLLFGDETATTEDHPAGPLSWAA